MAESTESKTIKELTKAVKDEQRQNRAKLEEIANSTGKSLEAIKDRAKAKQSLQKQDATLKEQQKISGLSAKRIQKADVLEQSIQRQQEIMEAQKAKLDQLGVDSATNKKFQEEELKLAKMQKAQAKATGSADAEDAADEKIASARQSTFLGKIANGITGLGKNVVEKTKEGAGDIMGMLKKFAFGAFAVAVLAFLRSPYFDKFLKVVKEQIVPALTTLIDDYIIPVAKVIWEGIVKTWENIKELFSGLKESFELFGEGKWVQGIIKFFSTIVTFVLKQIDVAATALFNTIATVFGFEGTDSVAGSIGQFFTDIYNNVKNYLVNMVNSVISTVSNIFTGITTFLSEKITAVIDYLKGIFGFDGEGFTFASLFDIAFSAINLTINLVKDIFGFGSPDEPFRLSEFISSAFGKVVDFFKSLLDFDIKSLIMKIPGAGTVMKALGGIGKFFSGGDVKKSIAPPPPPVYSDSSQQGPELGVDKAPPPPPAYADPRGSGPQGGFQPKYAKGEYVVGGIVYDAKGNSLGFQGYKENQQNVLGGANESADLDAIPASALPRSAGNRGRGMTPKGSESSAPPVAPVIDAKTIDNSRGGNVTRMTRQLAPRDRITDELKKAQGF